MSTVAIVLLVVGVLGVVAVIGIGIMSVLAIYGTRKYLAEAKRAEGKNGAMMLARGIAQCSEESGVLPASSHKVPASMSAVQGKKYMSTPSDWSGDKAFACAHFSMSMPQYFQYEWQLLGPGKGVARATADLDGDGVADPAIEIEVTCAGPGACKAGTLPAP